MYNKNALFSEVSTTSNIFGAIKIVVVILKQWNFNKSFYIRRTTNPERFDFKLKNHRISTSLYIPYNLLTKD